MSFYKLVACITSLVNLATTSYVLEDDYNASNLFSKFDFEEGYNPVNGFVKYVSKRDAEDTGLISQDRHSVYIGVGHTNVAPHGRKSVKLVSRKSFNKGLFILDIAHMPAGCATWPAFWLLGPRWPANGEIDIIEGINDQATNSMTLHTGPGCSIMNNGHFSGSIVTRHCNIHNPKQSPNAGCSIDAAKRGTYGKGLNAAGGGVYATEWTSEAISIFFSTLDSIPVDMMSGAPDPEAWGKPLAMFQGLCNIDDKFGSQRLIFNTAFCGNFSDVWSGSSCASKASSCHAFVRDHPSAFANVFWRINSLRVYQDNCS